MDGSIVSIGLVKRIFEKIQSIFLKKYFECSHLHYLKKRQLGNRWHSLSKTIEISIRFENTFSNDQTPESLIAIRNIGGEILERIDLTFYVESRSIVYQDEISLTNIDDKPRICVLKNIPIQNLYFINNGTVNTIYNWYWVNLNKIIVKGEVVESDLKTPKYVVQYYDFLNGKWSKKWGANWNLNFLEDKRFDLYLKLRHDIYEYPVIYSDRPLTKLSLLTSIISDPIRFTISIILTQKYVLHIIIWFQYVMDKDKFILNEHNN